MIKSEDVLQSTFYAIVMWDNNNKRQKQFEVISDNVDTAIDAAVIVANEARKKEEVKEFSRNNVTSLRIEYNPVYVVRETPEQDTSNV